MIHQVDKALEALLRKHVPLPEGSVDVSFRAPEPAWTASAARPTVDVFLWDVARAAGFSSAGFNERTKENGQRQRRQVPSQVAFRYVVTVWAREQRDEHELLGAVLRCVLGHGTLPPTLLPPSFEENPPRLTLASDQHRLPPQSWGGHSVKPSIFIEVTAGVDALGWSDRAPTVTTFRATVADSTPPLMNVPASPEPPPLRRYRTGGALVMEGRPDAQEPSGDGAPDEPDEGDGNAPHADHVT